MVNKILLAFLFGLFILILPVLAAFIVSLLRKKTAEIEDRMNSRSISRNIRTAQDIIESCVVSVSQTFVDDKKKKGAFDKPAQTMAFERCREKIVSSLSPEMEMAISCIYGDMDTFIDTRLEYYVKKNKSPGKNPG